MAESGAGRGGPVSMKFAEKYEIAEMVTSGRVTTFLARDRATQEALVVYTFECAGTGARELSTASIIARFCALAPNPPGMIVKAGFDEPSSSAFIATRMPEQAALQGWVKAYQAFGKPAAAAPPESPLVQDPFASPEHDSSADATMELSAMEVKSAMSRSAPPQAPEPDASGSTDAFSVGGGAKPGQSGGEFTRLFREVNAFQPLQSSKPPAPAKTANATDAMFGQKLGGAPLGGEKSAPPAPAAPAEPSPGSFTREFLGLSAEPAAKPSAPAAPAPPVAAKSEPGSFTREFMAFSQPAPRNEKPAEFSAPSKSAPPATSFDNIFGKPAATPSPEEEEAKAGPGEFTRFFQDPFEHPAAPQKPMAMPDITAAPPQKQAGAFTQMFGPGDLKAAASPPAPVIEEQGAAPGSFTQIFGDVSGGKGTPLGSSTLDTNPPARPSMFDPAPPAPPGPVAPPDPFRPAISSTPVAQPVSPLFSPTPAPQPPAANPFAGRPGSVDATNIFRAPGADAPPVEPVRGGPSEFTMFLSKSQLDASLASERGAAPPPVAAPPPPPAPFQFTPPAPPKLPKAPAVKMPKVPGMAEVPKPPSSILPLVTVLIALFAIAAMLVMYFALKH